MTKGNFLPYGRQSIDDDDVDAVVRVLRGDYLTTGPAIPQFEKTLCAAVGAKDAVACSSGTAALHLAAMALGLGEGDVVVVPSLTFLATANAARFVGAQVVFTDVDPDTGLMRPEDFNAALGGKHAGKIKAVFPVHLAGQCTDMKSIGDMAKAKNISVVEDACHALGTNVGNEKAGDCSHSHMTCFSFHPVKTVAMGEGGAVTTNDPALAEKLRRYRNHGMVSNPEQFSETDLAFDANGDANPWHYEMPDVGYNYRASDIHAALGNSQMKKLDTVVARRRALAEMYDVALAPLAPKVLPPKRVSGCNPAWHLYAARIDFNGAGVDRATVMRELRELGIGTQVHYIPVHLQPYYVKRYGKQDLPGAQSYFQRTLSLPLFPAMQDSDVDRVVRALKDVLGL